jgi:hypothetical protein
MTREFLKLQKTEKQELKAIKMNYTLGTRNFCRFVGESRRE